MLLLLLFYIGVAIAALVYNFPAQWKYYNSNRTFPLLKRRFENNINDTNDDTNYDDDDDLQKLDTLINDYQDELDALYYQLELYTELEKVQLNNSRKTENDIKKQIQTQKQIQAVRKKIKALENKIELLKYD